VGAENDDVKTAGQARRQSREQGWGEGDGRVLARPIAVDGMGEENTGADDAE
jgi:hypothetical protein